MHLARLAAVVAGLAATSVSAIPTITTKGSKFFTSDGNQFFVKGVAYQLVPDDPLIDGKQCQLDANLLKTLGANSLRVYHVDPAADHKSCMQTFADAGIYLWIDLDTFHTQIEQNSPTWNQTQYTFFQKVMDEFQKYDNTAGFFVGNEVLTTGNGSVAAPYVKAAARDMKTYRDKRGYRKIPVGYSAADIATLRPMLQNYLACGSNASEAVDFFSLNAYEWCGTSSYRESGYVFLTEMIVNYTVPIYFSETGCNTVKPRTFADQSAIFGAEMSPYWSGSIVYEWIEEANNYGIVSYGPKVDPASPNAPPDGFTRSGTPTPVQPDFSNLQAQWKTVSPSSIRMDAYKPTLTPPPCPAYTAGTWEVNGNVQLPALGATFNAAVVSSLSVGTAATGKASGTAAGASAAATTTSRAGAAAVPGVEGQAFGFGVVSALLGLLAWL